MQEKKNQEKTKPLPELEKEVTEILVANGRSFQPFIRTFSYTGENISKVNLGTLVGVFEVDERSEDSAYIVNFLASVAKKEYFSNPRRGAIESFEVALHKVNLALAELVKHGNVSWLGKFHGALGVLEKNHFHFSVTGQARILLFRNGSLADISEGLASVESNTHPIKTFVEVSSGRLLLEDQILLTSPELFSLFSLGEIEKNSSRMDRERFSQFLKTALRNELDMSGTIIIDIKKGIPKSAEKQGKKAEMLPNIHNVFSQSTFNTGSKKETTDDVTATPVPDQPADEYIDSKTGHIYVQGETPEDRTDSAFLDTVLVSLQDTLHSVRIFFSLQSKWLRKARKQSLLAFDSLSEQVKVSGKQTYRVIRKQWKKKFSEARKEELMKEEKKHFFTEEVPTEKEEPPIVPLVDIQHSAGMAHPQNTSPVSEEIAENEVSEEIPPFIKEKLANFYQKKNVPQNTPEKIPAERKIFRHFEKAFSLAASHWDKFKKTSEKSLRFAFRILTLCVETVRIFWKNALLFYKKLQPLQKRIVLACFTLLLVTIPLGVYLFNHVSLPLSPATVEKNDDKANLSVNTPGSENQNSGPQTIDPVVIENSIGTMVMTTMLDNETYIVTPRSIFHPRTQRSYALPGGSDARLASAMDDLRLIFILTEDNSLYAWSPINGSFTLNTLSLPENAKIASIGTYLTYLYVLESTSDQIYRFPRAEGGFGQSVNWLRDSASIEQDSKMAVNETLFLSPVPNVLQAYFRGRLTRTLEASGNSFTITALYTHPGLVNIYVLDKENKKIIVWNQEGNLVAQYSHNKLGEGKGLAVNEQTNEIFLITDDNTLLSFKLR